MSSELGQGSFHRATVLCSSVIILGASENRVCVADSERCLLRLFGGVGNWMKSIMLSLGDGKRILEITAGIPAIAGNVQCSPCHCKKNLFLFLFLFFFFP